LVGSSDEKELEDCLYEERILHILDMDISRCASPIFSSENLSNQLCDSLPAYVSVDDINQHPELSALLCNLGQRLTSTGVHRATQAKLDQQTTALKQARQKYLDVAVLHRLTQDVVNKVPLESDPGESKSDIKDLNELCEALTLAELPDHMLLPSDNGDEATAEHLFDVSPLVITAKVKTIVTPHHLKTLGQALEQKLETDWTKLAAFLNPIEFMSYDPVEIEKIPEYFEDKKKEIKSENYKLEHDIIQNDVLFQQVYSMYLDYTSLLNGLASKQRLSKFPEKHLSSISTDLTVHLLKMKCMKLQLMVSTYRKSTIPVLTSLRRQLDARIATADQKSARLNTQLDIYTGLDPNFQALLKEYDQIQKNIEFLRTSQ